MKEYSAVDAPWEHAGRTPLDRARLPLGFVRWKIEKKGFATLERGDVVQRRGDASYTFALDQEASVPPGMLRVPGAAQYALTMPGFEDLPPVRLSDYWIDQYEVTNRQFQQFVAAGGYQKREYWQEPFIKDGRPLSWEEAMAEFRDPTGRPGPATWEQGDFPKGQDDFPVTGVSWYEAAAFAEFAGKSLPTIYHSNKAAGTTAAFAIIPLSNFGGRGPARVGSYRGMSPSGAYDMAGNVGEWCWNLAGDQQRYLLGGAWSEPHYMFLDPDIQSPFRRAATYGFRCVKYIAPETISPHATAPVIVPKRDYNREKPVSEEVFRVYRSLYSYDQTPLSPVVETVDDSDESWRKEKVTFAAAYGNERVIAYLFLPKKRSPPYQTVVFFPGSSAIIARSSQELTGLRQIDFLMKSGRAVLHPIYKGTYERGDGRASDSPSTSAFYRDNVIAWSKDLGRSIDYLETRPEIDRGKLGYYGFSWGGALGVILPALEPRLKLVVMAAGGLVYQKALPEVDQINFISRVTQPVLLVTGRYDWGMPVETVQIPTFRLLGTPKEHKRQVILESGHAIPRNELIKETLNWLDRYWGPVK